MSEVRYILDGVEYREQDGHSLLVEAAARICGSRIRLAKRLGVSRSAVQQWLRGTLAPGAKRIDQMREIVAGASGSKEE